MNKPQPTVPQADGFRETLQSLTPADLPFLTPATPPAITRNTVSKKRRRSRGASPDTAISAATSPVQNADAITPAPTTDSAVQSGDAMAMPSPEPPAIMNAAQPADPATNLIPSRKRRHIERPWPDVGTTLSATYHGVVYTAEIVATAKRKRLKSGRQIRLLDGPAKGKRFNTFSRAMLAATAGQRRAGKLGRKGVGNGWTFWSPVDPATNVSPPVVPPAAHPVAS